MTKSHEGFTELHLHSYVQILVRKAEAAQDREISKNRGSVRSKVFYFGRMAMLKGLSLHIGKQFYDIPADVAARELLAAQRYVENAISCTEAEERDVFSFCQYLRRTARVAKGRIAISYSSWQRIKEVAAKQHALAQNGAKSAH